MALLFCGCSPRGDAAGIGRYVAPDRYDGQSLFAGKPELRVPLEEGAFSDASDTIYTPQCRWECDEEVFRCEEFSFRLPPAWEEHFGCTIHETAVPGHNLRTFRFDYVQADGVRMRVFSVEARDRAFCERYGEYGGDFVGQTEDGSFRYYFSSPGADFPDGFADYAAYVEILGFCLSEELCFSVNAPPVSGGP